MPDKNSFWSTIPGVLKGIAAVITAIGGLIAILYQFNVLPIRPNGNNINSQEINNLIERISEIDQHKEALLNEIGSLRPESEHNPDAVMAIREMERTIEDQNEEKEGLQRRLNQLQHR